MGLLFADTSSSGDFQAKAETALLHKLGCQACPLKQEPGRMSATGVARPLVYMLGVSPIRGDVERSEHFSGEAGDMVYRWIPKKFKPHLRWNNIVNSFVPKNQAPTAVALECCRPRVVKDIEEAKPKAIFGFGNAPLHWVSGFHGIQHWRGRRMPVQVGTHVCWYYAFSDPAELLRFARDNGGDFGSEDERMFMFDMRQAFADVEDGLEKPVIHTETIARANVECITDIRQIESALRWASQQPEVGLDYETNGLRPYATGAKILTAGVGTLEKAYAFPIHHPGAHYTKQQVADVIDLWTRFLLRASCVKVVHNLAFELEWSGFFFGTEVLRARPWQDTATAAAIIDERRGKQKPGPFSLEFLVQQYFGINLKKLSNIDRARLETTPLDKVLSYQGMDAKYHHGLWRKLWEEIQRLGLEHPYELAVRRVPTVTLSQLKGVPVDQERIKVLGKKYGGKVDAALGVIEGLDVIRDFKKVKGRAFNPQSNPDILYVFDDMLKRPEVRVVDKYTKVEKRSADESVLLQIEHPLSSALIELRSASGTKSKYIDALALGVEGTTLWSDGLLHCQFNTFFAETSRLSCEWPNLQNFPKRSAETKEVRSSVRAAAGCHVLAFDYGQIEARVIAMFTNDKRFVKALWDRYDVHQEWAERIAHEYPARVGGKKFLKDKKAMKTFRTDVKNQWTFPLFFGAKDTSVASYLKIPINVVRPLVREFWKQFSGVHDWQVLQLEAYRELGYTESLTGRRRHGPMSVNQIYNSPVQGTAAEIVLDAMCRLSETQDQRLQPEINIHDDLTFLRVPEKDIDVIAEKIIGMMLQVPFEWAHIVPITVEMSLGKNWADMEEIGNYSSDTWK